MLKRLPTTFRLLAFLSLALIPIGVALTVLMVQNLSQARRDQVAVAAKDAAAGASAVEAQIARTILAARLAANSTLRAGDSRSCAEMSRTLSIVPGVSNSFALGDPDGKLLCTSRDFPATARISTVAPRGTIVSIGDGGNLEIMMGVEGGSVTAIVPRDRLGAAFAGASPLATRSFLSDRTTVTRLVGAPHSAQSDLMIDRTRRFRQDIASGQLEIIVEEPIEPLKAADIVALGLPLIMWLLAGFGSWYLIHFWVIAPIARLRAAVATHEPGEAFVAPSRLGPMVEVQDLSDAFSRTVARIDESDRQMADALEGQRRLVREVHHRVKNNLQVIASLLSIQGRAAQTPEAKSAFAAMGRRVDALAVVHRNHFAEVEDNRGIALRPMLTELAQGLRATAPDAAKAIALDLNVVPASTTQDAAVAAAFFVTEIIEYAMLHGDPEAVIEIDLSRQSELAANLSVASSVLVEPQDSPHWQQFERIVQGIGRQLRTTVEKKVGRYCVEIPVFP